MIVLKRIWIFFIIILLVSAGGCTIIKPYTGEEKEAIVQEPEKNSLNDYKSENISGGANSAASETSSVQSGTTQSQSSSAENSNPSYTDTKPPALPPQQEPINEVYYANKSTKKFHKSTCGSAKLIKDVNLYTTQNRQELIDAGYSPCLRCNP